MKLCSGILFLLLLSGNALAQAAPAFPPAITHVVVIFQENRTPDNLFQDISPKCPLPVSPTPNCTPTVSAGCYDVSPCGLAQNAQGQDIVVTLTPHPLAGGYDPNHSHNSFELMCNPDPANLRSCRMDGAYLIPDGCNGDPECTNNGMGQQLSYKFTDNPALTYNNAYGTGNTSVLGPYLAFAKQYGWANFMYQTNQGPSYPAHQFIFSGTSARTAMNDSSAIFISENFKPAHTKAGCLAGDTSTNFEIGPNPNPSTCPAGCTCYDNNTVKECTIANNPPLDNIFCYNHATMDTLLGSANWKYYAPSQGSIWTAPDSFSALCGPVVNGLCTGPAFTGPNANVVISETKVLTDIQNNCKLAPVTWVIPDGRWSDHASSNDGTGPSWVAAIVNEIGGFQNTCGFWNNTAIVITWDDWGGWSDNQKPVVLNPISGQGDYQYGFRVPLIVVSAYTPQGYINNATHDFGSILRMIQAINGIPEGSLNFADLRATNDLHAFFSLTTPRTFTVVPAVKDPNYFITFTGAATAPDNDDDDQ